MSKKVATQPLSDNSRKLIIIIAIVLVAVIILSIALALILKTDEKTPAVDGSDNSSSSTLPIRNGDFLYSNSEATGFPHTAVNWTKYGYKAKSGSKQEFEEITNADRSVMGIVDVNAENWTEVAADIAPELNGATLNNPGKHSDELDDDNVYMIYNKEATSASILSDSVSVSSGASVRITVWLNLSQVKSGNAVVMIKKSDTYAESDSWYAYDFAIVAKEGEEVDENGWQKHEFYIFNREASTQYIRVSVGLGDVFQDENAEGVLFIDDISYETVTADEYRQQVDEHSDDITDDYTPYKIIENEDIDDDSEFYGLVQVINDEASTTAPQTFETSKAYVDAAGYSPFTERDDFYRDGKETGFKIFKIEQQGTDVTALRLEENVTLKSSPINKDHYHISFWVRVDKNSHAATKANVYIQKLGDDNKWEDLDTFSAITTSQEIDTDDKCGWVKYDIYLKPSTADTDTISILFVLGHKDAYTDSEKANGEVPRGSLYVTSPAYEQISYKDYNNASSGSYVKKINLVGDSASTSVSNGSFSDVNSIGNQPTNWTPVFAGDNAIYKDGKGDTLKADKKEASLVAGSGINRIGSAVDDAQKSVLQITARNTNFGYISNDITLSSRTVYVFSVLVKVEDGKNPFIYLVDNSKDRDKAIVASVEKADEDGHKSLDKYFDYSLDDVSGDVAGWVRYYLVFVTGAESASVRIALFNGKIAPKDDSEISSGESTILYDNVKMKSIGSYSFVEDEDNEDATNYLVKFSANSGFDDAIEDLFGKGADKELKKDYTDILNEDSEILKVLGKDGLNQPDADSWKEMSTIPEEDEDNKGDDEEQPTKTPSKVDWGLLMSVISSVMLVAALLIVFVIKLFQRKRPRTL